jgi:hypothetical protein
VPGGVPSPTGLPPPPGPWPPAPGMMNNWAPPLMPFGRGAPQPPAGVPQLIPPTSAGTQSQPTQSWGAAPATAAAPIPGTIPGAISASPQLFQQPGMQAQVYLVYNDENTSMVSSYLKLIDRKDGLLSKCIVVYLGIHIRKKKGPN